MLLIAALTLPAAAEDTAGYVPSPYASCVASCERDYVRCTEESGAARERLPGAGVMLNSGAECRSGLQSCIKSCKAMGAEKPQNENPTAPE